MLKLKIRIFKNGDGKPDSWPQEFYNPGLGSYVWPAFLGDQATAPYELEECP